MLVAINFFNAGQFVQLSILVIDSALQHTAQFMAEPDKLRLVRLRLVNSVCETDQAR